MSVRFYDRALFEKIASWVKDPNLRILKPDESTRLFEMTLDETNDKPLSLPLIAISRDKPIEILNTQKQPKTFNGFCIQKSTLKNNQVSIPMNVIPIQIGYQIDIYTRGLAEADEYLRNFVFNLINYPKLRIMLPYNNVKAQKSESDPDLVEVMHDCNIKLDPTLIDNSDIKEHLFADQFVRFTIKLSIDDAYFFSMPTITNVELELDGGYPEELKDLNDGLFVQDYHSGEIVEKSGIFDQT